MKLQFAQIRRGLWLALTSLCAMSLALILGIEHPLWAAMPVWAMSQPTRGLLLERGLFRLLGTILGAVIGLGILALQVDKFSTLLLLSLAVLLITPLIATLRAMLSYVPMMAGLTICIVCIPSLVHSGNGIAMAEARVACTLVGVITGLVFGYFLTPAAAISDFAKSVDELAKRTKCIAAEMLESGLIHDPESKRKLFADLRFLQEQALMIAAGSRNGYRRSRDIQALTHGILELLAAIKAFNHRTGRDSAGLALRLASELRSNEVLLNGLWCELEQHDTRLADALRIYVQELKHLQAPILNRGNIEWHEIFSPFRDAGLAWRSGVVAAVTTLLVTTFAVYGGVPYSEWGALGMALSAMMFGTHPAPARVAAIVLRGAAAGLLASLFFRLWMLPYATNGMLLILLIAPFIVLGGLARANPKLMAPAFDANQMFLLSSAASVPGVSDAMGVGWSIGILWASIAISCWLFPRITPNSDARRERLLRRLRCHLDEIIHAPLHKGLNTLSRQEFFNLASFTDFLSPKKGRSITSVYNLYEALTRLRTLYKLAASSEKQMIDQILHSMNRKDVSINMLARDLKHLAKSTLPDRYRWALLDVALSLRGCYALFPSLRPD